MREPVDTVILDGSQSSDDVGVVRYHWRQREGDPSVIMKGNRTEFLTLSNLKPGQYRFTLTVVDGAGQRDTDNVLVTIIAGNIVFIETYTTCIFLARLFWNKKRRYCQDPGVGVSVCIGMTNFILGTQV